MASKTTLEILPGSIPRTNQKGLRTGLLACKRWLYPYPDPVTLLPILLTPASRTRWPEPPPFELTPERV